MLPPPSPSVGGTYCSWCGSLRCIVLSALYLLNEWVDFDQTCTDTLLGGGKKWLDFWDLALVFKVTPALINFQILTKKSLSAPYLLNQMTDSGQTSYIVTRWFKDLIRFWWPWPNFQGHHTIKTKKWALSALYLLNQLVDFDQTCVETPLGHGKEIIRFWRPWPHFQGHTSFKCQILTSKSLSALCLLNQMMGSSQTLCIVSLG